MKEKVDSLISQLSEVLENISSDLEGQEDEIKDKKILLSQIKKMIESLEKQGISVPGDFREQKVKLKLDLDSKNEKIELMKYILSSIRKIYNQYQTMLAKVQPGETGITQGGYRGNKPIAFSFCAKRIKVKNWIDLYGKFINIIAKENSNFRSVLKQIHGTKRQYFSEDPAQLSYPQKLPDFEYYYERKLSSKQMINIISRIIDKFGYSRGDLEIET